MNNKREVLGARWTGLAFLAALFVVFGLCMNRAEANDKVYVTRFWHNHQPIYWPEWNSNGGETDRGQLAWDSIVLKPTQNYGGLSPRNNPENNLTDIFGIDDRKSSYQGRPRDALSKIGQSGGFGMSYSGSLIDNVRQLGGGGHLGYGGGWNWGNTEARGWKTPSGSSRMDMLGFTYHHSLAPLLPKEVFRKELQIFKQAWWKAWGGNADLSDHSKGFFPTEMAYTRDLIDVLVDEGYDWLIVASHHISRTSPSYNDHADPEGSYNIFSSPPNKADQLGPTFGSGWWFDQPNPGNAAWNVAPYAYQLHKVKYVNPETGTEKTMVAVPSDDVLSYQAGYSGAQIGRVDSSIAPFATDPNRPVVVIPSTDGDNAWGGGYDSWEVATPGFFGAAESRGYKITTMQDFVNQFGQHAPVTHIEDGAWIYPEMCYGSPNFLKWIEPPVNPKNIASCYPNTMVDMETPGYALKFFSYAPLMAGANWCITAEQIMRDQGGDVRPWVIQAPYDWDGQGFGDRNVVELAWHIYLKGLDSGFNYYGGLGNDDEVKPSLATKRAVDKLRDWMSTRLELDQTGPTVLKPQRFPYNPGWYTFGWFNKIPGGDERFLKRMGSEFYIWTHAYDVSGVQSINVKIRRDKDGVRSLSNNHNETYAGGSDVEEWVTLPMTKRTLPNTRAELNARADNGEIDFFVYDLPGTIELADYYFVKITDENLPGFRDNLFDYYIEATDTRGNTSKSEIQHVWVENDGVSPSSSAQFSSDPNNCSPLSVTYNAANGPLEGVNPIYMQISLDGGSTWDRHLMGGYPDTWTYTIASVPSNATSASVWFENTAGTVSDSRGGLNWNTSIRDCNAPVGPSAALVEPAQPGDCEPILVRYYPNEGPLQHASSVYIHIGHDGWEDVIMPNPVMTKVGNNWEYTYTPAAGIQQINVVFNDGADIWDNHGGLDWHFTVTNCAGPIPDGIVITNPPTDIAVANAQSTYTIRGTAKNISGELFWTNNVTGGAGAIIAASSWAIHNMPVGVGANTITVSGMSSTGSGGTTIAADDGSDSVYNNGWSHGQNGGTGFGAWQFYRTTEDGDKAGWFTRSLILGERSWAMYANTTEMAEAKRPFNSALQVGQTFHVKMRNGSIDPGAGVGIALQNTSGDTLWQFFFNGGDENYSITDGTTDIGWTASGLEVEFTLASASTFSVKILPYGSSQRTITGSLEANADQDIVLFRAWNNYAGAGEDYDYYINDLRITSAGEPAPYSDSVTITRAAGGTDSNGDGVPDDWYNQYGYNPLDPVVGNQLAANGHTVKECYLLNVNPTNAEAYKLKMDPVEQITQGQMRLRWYSEAGRRYAIDATDDLSQGFTNVLTIITETENRTRSYDDVTADNIGKRYYRLRYIGQD